MAGKKRGTMARSSQTSGSPTMIIPNGTHIRVDAHGQLSIRTPGNLVIQNSGSYADLESVSGSIRIEPNVQVEAVNVRCSETCYVQGSLTAWQVVAKNLHLDGEAEAHILMQQTEGMEVGRQARLVGNFHSEKELFLLFSRFARQVRSLPFAFTEGAEESEPDLRVANSEDEPSRMKSKEGTALPAGSRSPLDDEVIDVTHEEVLSSQQEDERQRALAVEELPEGLFFAFVLLERESDLSTHGPSIRRILVELVNLLRERDFETLRHTYKTLFGRIRDPSVDLEKASRLISSYFENEASS